MPKIKTNSGAKKRFTLTGSGKIKRKHAFKSHILTKKTKKQKRNLTHYAILARLKISQVLKSQDKHNASHFSKMSCKLMACECKVT